MIVLLDGKKHIIPKTELQLAYALTDHRAQGGQYNNVFVCIPTVCNWSVIDGRWLYTAITRAKKKLIYSCSASNHRLIVNRGFRIVNTLMSYHLQSKIY